MTDDDIEQLVATAANDGSPLSRKHLFRAITFAEVPAPGATQSERQLANLPCRGRARPSWAVQRELERPTPPRERRV